jgi:hypothetical protein
VKVRAVKSFTVRLTQTEWQLLAQLAYFDHASSVSAYVRKLILKEAASRGLKPGVRARLSAEARRRRRRRMPIDTPLEEGQ